MPRWPCALTHAGFWQPRQRPPPPYRTPRARRVAASRGLPDRAPCFPSPPVSFQPITLPPLLLPLPPTRPPLLARARALDLARARASRRSRRTATRD